MSVYLIDGEAVNERTDWIHAPAPGRAQVRREEQFPGVGELLVVRGPRVGRELIVVGFLEGTAETRTAAIAALDAKIYAGDELLESLVTHTVQIHDLQLAAMDLVEFEAIPSFGGGRTIEAVAAADGHKVLARVRYRWRQLS